MKRYMAATFLATIVTVLLTSAAVVWAQDEELTLAGVAEQLNALVDRVTTIEERLEPVTTTDGVCVQYSHNQLQRETITKYLNAFEEDVGSLVTLKSVRYSTDSGLTTYHFEEAFTDRSVTETWNGCEFVDTGEWVEE